MAEDGPLLLYTTFPDEDSALAVGEALVRDGLAACMNVISGMRSVYRWNGAVERGTEVVALVKTRTALRDRAEAALKARHPYETPVILLIAAEAEGATHAWIMASTDGTSVTKD